MFVSENAAPVLIAVEAAPPTVVPDAPQYPDVTTTIVGVPEKVIEKLVLATEAPSSP